MEPVGANMCNEGVSGILRSLTFVQDKHPILMSILGVLFKEERMKRLATLCSLLLISQLAMATDVVSVVDANNQPIQNATILLGFEAGNPFPNNTLTTGAAGTASVPGDWKAALPVTVQAPGYITTTIPVA